MLILLFKQYLHLIQCLHKFPFRLSSTQALLRQTGNNFIYFILELRRNETSHITEGQVTLNTSFEADIEFYFLEVNFFYNQIWHNKMIFWYFRFVLNPEEHYVLIDSKSNITYHQVGIKQCSVIFIKVLKYFLFPLHSCLQSWINNIA